MAFRDVISPLMSSKTLGYVSSLALMAGIYSCLPVWKEYSSYSAFADMPSGFHAALSMVLGALLVFRTNSSYARWWEARTLWGGLVNASRNVAMKLTSFGNLDKTDLEFCEATLCEFPKQLMLHLRSPLNNRSTESGSAEIKRTHAPAMLIQSMYKRLGLARKSEHIDGHELRMLDIELSRLTDICGGCERIARTLIVRSYRIFVRQCILLFLLTLPWGIASDFRWWTIPLTIITAYFMIGMEVVAEHVEEPFGLDEDDWDLEGLCLVIDSSVRDIFSRHRRMPLGTEPNA